jgi:hypothetical protein
MPPLAGNPVTRKPASQVTESAEILDRQRFRVREDAGVPVAARATLGMDEQRAGARATAGYPVTIASVLEAVVGRSGQRERLRRSR